jgi:hypothetical protein
LIGAMDNASSRASTEERIGIREARLVLRRVQSGSAEVEVRSVSRVADGYEVVLVLDHAVDIDGIYSLVRWDDRPDD